MKTNIVTIVLLLLILIVTNVATLNAVVTPEDCDVALNKCLQKYWLDPMGIFRMYCYNGWLFCMAWMV